MSTLFMRKNEKSFLEHGIRKGLGVPEEAVCTLCGGGIYPGDDYYWLDGGRICETCLERYARRYFAPQRRRLERKGAVRHVSG